MSNGAPRIDHYTAPDGYAFAVRVWDVPEPVARIVFVHGIVSHGGWYLAACRHLASAGFEVHFVDRRGSGLNARALGDVDRYQTWLVDVESYLESLSPALRAVLLGISWGGKLVAAVARHRPELIAAAGMICPGLFARQQANRLQRLALRLAGIAGLRGVRVTIPLQDPALFTDSPRWRAYLRDDPLTLRKVTIAFALADLDLNLYAAEAPEEIDVPLLLMLAGRDRIVDNRRVREFFESTRSSNKELIEYPQAAHTLEFEPDPLPYFEDLRGWAEDVVRRQ